MHCRVLGEAVVSTAGNIFIQAIVGRAVEAKLVTFNFTQYVAKTNGEQAIVSMSLHAPPMYLQSPI